MSLSQQARASIAVTRFGLGARPGEIAAATADPAGFLKAQISPAGADQPVGDLASTAEGLAAFSRFQMARKQAQAAGDPETVVKDDFKPIRQAVAAEFLARMQLASTTDAGFRERWALFWFNHFTVSDTKQATIPVIGAFEREAIRPRVFGRFEDLLAASSTHPAMLLYLDQAHSIGPGSPAALRRGGAGAGLNENLAREIMELHTLGVGSGYTQADVTEFARALTGWSIPGPNQTPNVGQNGGPAGFLFRPQTHEPGPRHILGKTYNQQGVAQAAAVLRDLAAHPATAHHLSVKLARHFVADDPPPALVARLERTYTASGGRLDRMAEALIDAPEAWEPQQRKFKTPYEFLVSSYRAAGQAPADITKVAPILNAQGQRIYGAPSPKGWAEEAQDWASPDGIIKRLSWSEAFAAAATPPQSAPIEIARNALGVQLTPAVATAITRAESRPEAFAILLMSPEFQRR